jgi:hypothetical protein
MNELETFSELFYVGGFLGSPQAPFYVVQQRQKGTKKVCLCGYKLLGKVSLEASAIVFPFSCSAQGSLPPLLYLFSQARELRFQRGFRRERLLRIRGLNLFFWLFLLYEYLGFGFQVVHNWEG